MTGMRGSPGAGDQPEVEDVVGRVVGRDAELAAVDAALAAGARGAVLVGEAGVGTTCLALEAARLVAGASGSGVPVPDPLVIRGSRSLREVPLGVLALALADDPTRAAAASPGPNPADRPGGAVDPRHALRQMHDAVVAHGGAGPTTIVLDDAHHLDDDSATLVHQLVLGGRARVVATIRSGSDPPEGVHLLWRDELCPRVEVGPLGLEPLRTVAERQLGGPVERDSLLRLHRTTGGNPLYLRELLRDAAAHGRLVERGSSWAWTGSGEVTPRLDELVSAIVGRLPDDERRMMEVLALVEVLPLSVAEVVAEPRVLGALEARGLAVVRREPEPRPGVAGRTIVAPGHAVHGEVFRPPEGGARERELLRDVVVAFGERVTNPVDRLRLAHWRLTLDLPVDPFELLDLAESAYGRSDVLLARRMARRAMAELEGADRARAAVVLGELLIEAARHEEADRVLAPLVERDLPPRVLARAVAARLRALCHALGQFDLAELEVAPHIARIDDPHWRRFVRAQWATQLARHGRLDAARLEVDELGDDPSDLVRLRLAPARGTVLCFSGRPEAAHAAAQALVPLALASRADVPAGVAWVGGQLLTAAMLSGHLGEAHDLLALFEADDLHHLPTNRANTSYMRARLELLRGDGPEAVRLAASAVALYLGNDSENWRAMAIGVLLEACGHTGRADLAGPALAEFDQELTLGGDHLFELEARRGMAWGHVALGDAGRASDLLAALATEARADGIPLAAAWALHDRLRLGDLAVAGELAELTADFDGARAGTIHRHAAAVAADDATGVESAAAAFEDLGFVVFAAEAFADAVAGHRRSGVDAGVRRASARALALRARCRGIVTPGLVQPLEAERLTRRESEIGRLAATGLASKDIAEQLHLSVRTVDGHLGRIYDKLGVRSRTELAAALGGSVG